MRSRDVSRLAAKRLQSDSSTVEFFVEGWLRVALELLGDGHSIPTVLGTLRVKRADARLQRSRGYRRDLKIVTSVEARSVLDRASPTRRYPRRRTNVRPPIRVQGANVESRDVAEPVVGVSPWRNVVVRSAPG